MKELYCQTPSADGFLSEKIFSSGVFLGYRLVRLRGGGELARVKNGSKALEYVTSSLLRDKRVTEGTIANFRAHLRGIAEKFRIAHVDDRAGVLRHAHPAGVASIHP